MAVLRPLKVVIENYPADQVEQLPAQNHPQDPAMGTRLLPFCRELYIERDDFMEDPPKKFFRLAPGREVRLRYAYFITCREVIRDNRNEVVELRCSYDPQTRGGDAPDGRKVKGTIHWVSARHGIPAEVRLYDRLFTVPNPDKGGDDWEQYLNPDSEQILSACVVEPGLRSTGSEDRFQFERLGYFCTDRYDSSPERPAFNRIVTLRDSWGKIQSGEP